MAVFYCVKCKAKKEIAEFEKITMKNGRPAAQSVCPDCGTKVFKIGNVEQKRELERNFFK